MEINNLLAMYIQDNNGYIDDEYECLAISPDADPPYGDPYDLSFKIDFRENIPFEWHCFSIKNFIKDNKPDLERINKLANRLFVFYRNKY